MRNGKVRYRVDYRYVSEDGTTDWSSYAEGRSLDYVRSDAQGILDENKNRGENIRAEVRVVRVRVTEEEVPDWQ